MFISPGENPELSKSTANSESSESGSFANLAQKYKRMSADNAMKAKNKRDVFLIDYQKPSVSKVSGITGQPCSVIFRPGQQLALLVVSIPTGQSQSSLTPSTPTEIVEYTLSPNDPDLICHTNRAAFRVSSRTVLADNLFACSGATLHPEAKHLVFFGREEQPFWHDSSRSMFALDLESNLIGQVVPRVGHSEGQFNGFHAEALEYSIKAFVCNGDYLVAGAVKNEFRELYLFRTSKEFLGDPNSVLPCVRLKNVLGNCPDKDHLSLDIADVLGNKLLVSVSNSLRPHRVLMLDLSDHVKLAKAFDKKHPEALLDCVRVYSPPELKITADLCSCKKLKLSLSNSQKLGSVFVYTAPTKSKFSQTRACEGIASVSVSKPTNSRLACIFRKEPFGAGVDSFDDLTALLLDQGFDVMKVNHRGTVGYGTLYQASLTGTCGRFELDDCKEAIVKARDSGLGTGGVRFRGL